jgi:uncharacterized oxidoreductase
MSRPLSKPTTVLLTGATSGVGACLLHQLLAQGHRVIAPARRAAQLPAAAGLIPITCDLSDLQALPQHIADWCARYPEVTVLINCAAVQHAFALQDQRSTPLHLIEEAALNLIAPALLAQAFLPSLTNAPDAAIVNISSGLAIFPKQQGGLYSATKAGLSSLTTFLRWQCEDSGILVTEVVLPMVDTPMTAGRGRAKLAPDSVAKAILAGISARKTIIRLGSARALPALQVLAPWLGRRILRGA